MFYKTDFKVGSPDEESQEGKNLTDDEIELFSESFEEEVLQIPKNTPIPFILSPVGLIASGKTTTINALTQHFSLLKISSDEIRAFLRKHGYNFQRTVEIGVHLAIKYLKAGYGVAIDADIVAPHNCLAIEELAKKFNVPLIYIHIKTSEKVILQRLREDNSDRDYKGQEAIDRYFERKPLHEKILIEFDYVFNGAGDFDQQLKEAIDVIEQKLEC
jgi:predicted kinase